MGKVQITLESKSLPSSVLAQLAGIIIPDNDTMRNILLDIIGIAPKEIVATIKEFKDDTHILDDTEE
jgi:hypothetical protein